MDFFGNRILHGNNARFCLRRGTPSQKHIRRTLGQKRGFSGNFVQGGHQLSVRIKGQLLQTGETLPNFVFISACLAAKCQKGGFGRVTDLCILVDGPVIAKHTLPDKLL